jgi:hypothetical protein
MGTLIVFVIIAVMFNMSLGAFWYSPKLFGVKWASELGFQIDQMKGTPRQYASAILVSFVLVFGVLGAVKLANITSIWTGILFGLVLWAGFILPTHLSGVIWAKKPLKVYLIDIAYYLPVILVNTLLFVFTNK